MPCLVTLAIDNWRQEKRKRKWLSEDEIGLVDCSKAKLSESGHDWYPRYLKSRVVVGTANPHSGGRRTGLTWVSFYINATCCTLLLLSYAIPVVYASIIRVLPRCLLTCGAYDNSWPISATLRAGFLIFYPFSTPSTTVLTKAP